MGKAKARLSASSILKKYIWGNTAAKQKLCRGNTVAIHIFKKKNYKAKFSTNLI
jgi:hypothetical protein